MVKVQNSSVLTEKRVLVLTRDDLVETAERERATLTLKAAEISKNIWAHNQRDNTIKEAADEDGSSKTK